MRTNLSAALSGNAMMLLPYAQAQSSQADRTKLAPDNSGDSHRDCRDAVTDYAEVVK